MDSSRRTSSFERSRNGLTPAPCAVSGDGAFEYDFISICLSCGQKNEKSRVPDADLERSSVSEGIFENNRWFHQKMMQSRLFGGASQHAGVIGRREAASEGRST